MFHKCSSLIERKVRLFSNKQEFLPLLYLKSFRQFQNLSEEMMEPCRWKFDRIILRSVSEIIAISILHFASLCSWVVRFEFSLRCMDVLATNAQISMRRNLMLNFVKLKLRIFMRHTLSYWPITGDGDIEQFQIFNLFASAWDPKSQLELSESCCRDVTHYAPKIPCE